MSAPVAAGVTSVLEAAPPRFTAAEIAAFAERLYGVRGEASDLGSERDQTFLVADGAGGGILKVSNSGETAPVLDLETAAVLHIARAGPDLPVARPLPVPGGDPAAGPAAYRTTVEGSEGPHFVRMFERMPGRASLVGSELSDDALVAFGAVVARVGRALRGFFHPAAGRALLWDVQHAASLRPLVDEIPDAGGRALAARALDRYEAAVAPAWPRLRAQVIHGDLSLDNVLVDERGRVTGVVDFGDVTWSALAVDVAVALASATRGRGGDDLFRAARLVLDGVDSVTPLEREERALMPALLGARLATIVTISAWRVRRYPDNAAYIQAWDADSWAQLELLEAVGADEAARRMGGPRRPAATAALVARRRRALGPAMAPLSYERPLHLVRGEGVWLVDADGRRYLDAYNNVPVVGHGHPRVAEAIAAQTRALQTNARYLYEPLVELAERLAATMPASAGLDTVMLVNSGSEANDIAWRIAREVTGRAGALVTAHAYHGVTAATADLSPEEWPRGRRPAHVETIPPPGDGEDGALAEAVGGLLARQVEPAALFLDSGFTSDGILTPPAGAVAALAAGIRDAGALLVADEVQAGHGRTGEALWSFAGYGLVPDVVTLGKPMGNGFPVAAVIARADAVDRFAKAGEFFSTFGGSPVAAAAALAVLDVIEDERLIERAAAVGAELRASLAGIAARHDAVGAVRGRGLLIGVEIVDPAAGRPDAALARQVMNRLRDRGVLVGTTGPAGNVLKIRPPLAFGREHAALLVDALDAALVA
jgi:4-aminobutyrate aminotransferase-like enzyme/Ser/Thr protein kinase RdoA (MazF antagonist)